VREVGRREGARRRRTALSGGGFSVRLSWTRRRESLWRRRRDLVAYGRLRCGLASGRFRTSPQTISDCTSHEPRCFGETFRRNFELVDKRKAAGEDGAWIVAKNSSSTHPVRANYTNPALLFQIPRAVLCRLGARPGTTATTMVGRTRKKLMYNKVGFGCSR